MTSKLSRRPLHVVSEPFFVPEGIQVVPSRPSTTPLQHICRLCLREELRRPPNAKGLYFLNPAPNPLKLSAVYANFGLVYEYRVRTCCILAIRAKIVLQ
jgi:hypothetical protein